MTKHTEEDIKALRVTYGKIMTCHDCNGPMLITDCGIVCQTGHGKIVQPDVSLSQLLLAYPDRDARNISAPRPRSKKECQAQRDLPFD